jgi:hypothetical protein
VSRRVRHVLACVLAIAFGFDDALLAQCNHRCRRERRAAMDRMALLSTRLTRTSLTWVCQTSGDVWSRAHFPATSTVQGCIHNRRDDRVWSVGKRETMPARDWSGWRAFVGV